MTKTVLAALALLMAGIAAHAADAPFQFKISRIDPPAEPGAIALDTGGVDGMPRESWFSDGTQRAARNVSHATLTPVIPAKNVKATGAAVIVLPGGGFKMMSMDNEGWPLARWFADHGVAAFILKYRLTPSPADEKAFQDEMNATIRKVMSGGPVEKLETPPQSLADAHAALRWVRANATRYGVDPKRVGMMGFSAGAMTTLSAVLTSTPAEQPAFAALIYGPMTAVDVPASAPPLFASLAADDPLFSKQGYGLMESWQRAGKPAELHVYQSGGHGYGMGRPGTTTVDWKDSMLHWLKVNHFLGKQP